MRRAAAGAAGSRALDSIDPSLCISRCVLAYSPLHHPGQSEAPRLSLTDRRFSDAHWRAAGAQERTRARADLDDVRSSPFTPLLTDG